MNEQLKYIRKNNDLLVNSAKLNQLEMSSTFLEEDRALDLEDISKLKIYIM